MHDVSPGGRSGRCLHLFGHGHLDTVGNVDAHGHGDETVAADVFVEHAASLEVVDLQCDDVVADDTDATALGRDGSLYPALDSVAYAGNAVGVDDVDGFLLKLEGADVEHGIAEAVEHAEGDFSFFVEQEFNRAPSIEEMADMTGLDEEKIRQAVTDAGYEFVSLN